MRPAFRTLIGGVGTLALAFGSADVALAYTAYVGNQGSSTLTPIDTLTNVTSPAIAVNDPGSVAITPDGGTAWVTNYNEATVTPVDLAAGTAGAPIPVGANPWGIAITPRRQQGLHGQLGVRHGYAYRPQHQDGRYPDPGRD